LSLTRRDTLSDVNVAEDDERKVGSKTVAALRGVTVRTLGRWLRNAALEFPKPERVNNRRYWTVGPVRVWKPPSTIPAPPTRRPSEPMARKRDGGPRLRARRPRSFVQSATTNDSEDNRRAGTQQQPLPFVIAAIPAHDGEVRVTLDEFKGHLTVDIRLFEPFTPAKVLMPTRKGVTLGLCKLPDLARALASAEAKARELGLLDE
jgi:hypothetical protein